MAVTAGHGGYQGGRKADRGISLAGGDLPGGGSPAQGPGGGVGHVFGGIADLGPEYGALYD